jgi:hypothetical protein
VASREEAAAENRERATRRANSRVRRYAVANGCDRLAVLTFAEGRFDRAEVVRLCAAFERRARRELPELAWIRTFEWHPEGHGLHVNYVVNRFVDQRGLQRLWGHGHVWIERFKGNGSRRENARAAARYAAKYIAKSPVADAGQHRYEVAQGFQPATVRVRAYGRGVAVWAACRALGSEAPAYLWDSASDREWRGPPAIFIRV